MASGADVGQEFGAEGGTVCQEPWRVMEYW